MPVGEAGEQLVRHEGPDLTGRIVHGVPGQVATGPGVRFLEMTGGIALRGHQRVGADHACRGGVRQHGVAATGLLKNVLLGHHERFRPRLSFEGQHVAPVDARPMHEPDPTHQRW
jgi:hypothetical protein